MRVALAICVLLGAGLMAPGEPGPAVKPPPDPEPKLASFDVVRGMTVSCQTWGWEWGTDGMVEAMRELKALGVNWIAIHPYAGIRSDGTVRIHQRWYGENNWLTRPIELGLLGGDFCQLGGEVFLKAAMASASWA